MGGVFVSCHVKDREIFLLCFHKQELLFIAQHRVLKCTVIGFRLLFHVAGNL